MSRGVSILSWALRNALGRTLFQPFHMINLLKFRSGGGQQTYDLYRDAAAGVVMREGGGLAYMGAAVVRAPWRTIHQRDRVKSTIQHQGLHRHNQKARQAVPGIKWLYVFWPAEQCRGLSSSRQALRDSLAAQYTLLLPADKPVLLQLLS